MEKCDDTFETASMEDSRQEVHREQEKKTNELTTEDKAALEMVKECFHNVDEPLGNGPGFEWMNFGRATDVTSKTSLKIQKLTLKLKMVPQFAELSHAGMKVQLLNGMVELLTIQALQSVPWKEYGLVEMFAPKYEAMMTEPRDAPLPPLQTIVDLHDKLLDNELAVSLIMLIVIFKHREDEEISYLDRNLIVKHSKFYSGLLTRYGTSIYGEEWKGMEELLDRALSFLPTFAGRFKDMYSAYKSEESDPLFNQFF